MLWHPQADGFSLRVADAAWHFFGGLQNKSKSTGSGLLDQAKLPIVDFRIVGQLAKVTAQQCQVVFVIYPAYAAKLIGGGFVVQMANQRIAGVGRNSQNTALLEKCYGLFEQARLWVVWMN